MLDRNLVLSVGLLLASCDSEPAAKPTPEPARGPSKVEIIAAPGGSEEATVVIQRESARVKEQGRTLVVYVGAEWCEPCKRFHEAAAAGQLDKDFPTLTLLEFDHDRDEARLLRAGCKSQLIPLFARPDDQGRCSARRLEGSIKGPGAVDEIKPRLAAILR
jgi:thiol-disulfide isomerase/thioredoxin